MKELFRISFDAKTEEIEKAYIAFQHKFAMRKQVLYSIVYLIIIGLGVDLIIKNPTNPAGYIAGGLAAGILVFNWVKPVTIRKRLVRTLSELNDETYTAAFFDDRIEIETEISEEPQETETVAITSQGVITVEEGSEAAKEIAENPDLVTDNTKPEKTVYNLAETDIRFQEKEGLFYLFVNRAYIHTIPLRCLTDKEAEQVRAYFADKAIGA